MIITYGINSQGLLSKDKGSLAEAAWIDIVKPTPEECELLLKELNVRLPLQHEMMQIEYSNRFYEENRALFLSAFVVTKVVPTPESYMFSFIVTPHQLITVRFFDLDPFKDVVQQLGTRRRPPKNHIDLFILLLDTLAGRVADIFEIFQEKTESLGSGLNGTMHGAKKIKNSNRLNEILNEIIGLENLLSKCYQNLSSLQLLVGFFQQNYDKHFEDNFDKKLTILQKDINAMIKHGEFLNQKLEFQLESTLGLINIEQTHIIKTFTVLAMIFMPPTLIASIYGMNFHRMPELNLYYGYPIALGVMLISGIFPYLFFKRKGWL